MTNPTWKNPLDRLIRRVSQAILASLVFSAFAFPQSPPASALRNQATGNPSLPELQRLFQNPPDDARIMMRWWWFGPAVTTRQLEREMRLMKEGGIGGFEVQPVYPLALDDETTGIKTLPFLSDEFIEALRFTSEKARELGLRVDLTLGSGWPYGGPQVSISHAAGRLRVERVKVDANSRRVKVPDIGAGEKLLAAFLARSHGQPIASESLRELTDIKDGATWLPAALNEPQEVLFFISSRTGMQVKRPAVGSEGYVLNHFDRAAVDHYLKQVGDRLMQAFGSTRPYAIFCDSLEVYNSDWTGDFMEEFRKRRGYDLKPHLPALAFDMGPTTVAVRHDWGRTLTELIEERFFAPMKEWSKANRTLFRIQGYGAPAAAVSSNIHGDLTEGEGSFWKRLTATRWASSANHLYGRPVTSSETWTWLHSPVFRATPLDLKAEADRHFLQGINQLIGHGWPYTAEGVEYPGWRFYAAGVFNEKNPWWIVMPDLSRYLQRLSFLLRQGRPANDVALYLPNSDAWASFTPGQVDLYQTLARRIGPDVVRRILEGGYGFDVFDDRALEQVGRMEKGALVMGPTRSRVVVLPGVEAIPVSTLRKLADFVRSGGTLIATRRLPMTAPGFMATDAEKTEVRETVRQLFESPSAPARFVADEAQLGATLTSLVTPDVALSPAAPDVGFIHRSTDSAEIYFLVNSDNVPHTTKATFRVEGMEPDWWDPMTGKIQPATVVERSPGGVSIALDLEPYGSRVLFFWRRARQSQQSPPTTTAPQVIDLSAGWQVRFGDTGAPIRMEQLRSWTEDENTRYYSGVATYEKTVILPDNFLRSGVRVKLDFGDGKPVEATQPSPRTSGMRALLDGPVREAAVITVNGRRAGSVWCPPYSLDVTEFLKSGDNTLRIVVGNLAINHIAGRALPDYRLLNLRYTERFQAQDMDKVQPIAAGLLGPIRLVAIGN